MSYGKQPVDMAYLGAQQFAPPSTAAQQSEISHFIEQLAQKATALENWMTSLNDKLRPATRQEPCANKVEQAAMRPTCTEIGSTLSALNARLADVVARMDAQHGALEI